MKIDTYNNKVLPPRANQPGTATGTDNLKSNASKTDISDINHGATSADITMLALKTQIQHEVSQPATAERLAELREQINSGEYHVSTEQLVNSILRDKKE